MTEKCHYFAHWRSAGAQPKTICSEFLINSFQKSARVREFSITFQTSKTFTGNYHNMLRG